MKITRLLIITEKEIISLKGLCILTFYATTDSPFKSQLSSRIDIRRPFKISNTCDPGPRCICLCTLGL